MANSKALYSEWVATQDSLPIFMQPWWMDAVCAGKEWDVILVHQNGRIIAAMPYLLRKRLGGLLRFILMPPQTQINGVWMEKGADEQYVADEIAKQIDALNIDYYYQHFPLRSPIPRLLGKHGFLVEERVTYRIDDLSDIETIVRHMSKNKTRQLKHAEELGLTIDWDVDAEQFYRLHKQLLEERGRHISYSREFLLVLERKTHRLGQSQILVVRNQAGEVCAGVYLVWDQKSMYYLIPFFNPALKDSGAGTLIALESMKLAKEKGLHFDFEGSMVRSIASHYRQMGGDPTIYCSVEKCFRWWFIIVLKCQKWLLKIRK